MQDTELPDFLRKTHSLFKDQTLPLHLKSKAIQEILSYLSNNIILNPIPFFLEGGLLIDIFNLKGYERDYELLELLSILIKAASKSAMKSLLEIGALEFLFSYIPHRKSRVLAEVAFLLGKFAGLSINAREAILKSCNFLLILQLLCKENDPNILLNVSYFIYRCSFDLSSSSQIQNFTSCLKYVRFLMISQNGVILANIYETISNLIEFDIGVFSREAFGFEKDFLISFDKWSDYNYNTMLTNEENLFVSFIKPFIGFVKSYDEVFITIAIKRFIIEKICMILLDDGSKLQKFAITLFEEIYKKINSEEILGYLINIKGLMKWIEENLLQDRREKFNLCLLIITSSLIKNPIKFGHKLNNETRCLKILAGCYESLAFKEKRMKVLGLFNIYLRALLSNKNDNDKNYGENQRELMKELGKIKGDLRDDEDEVEELMDLQKKVAEMMKLKEIYLEKGFALMKI